MNTLVLKVVVTPALMGVASLAGRRFGSAVSGWLIGLPFTSGPIIFFLALGHGTAFAADSATGTLAGAVSQAAFCLVCGWLAWYAGWVWALLGGSLAFAAVTIVLRDMVLAPLPLFLAVLVTLALALWLMPRARDVKAAAPSSPAAAPWWDLPARMTIATAFVVLLTEIAPLLGAQLTGLLAPFPLFAAILTVFAYRQQGRAPAVGVLRGLLIGLYAFAIFFFVVAMLIVQLGTALTFAIAIVGALAMQGVSLALMRRAQAST